MSQDPIVEEVREIRHQIDKECGQDPEKYYQHFQKLQKKLQKRLVRRMPKPLPVIKQKTGFSDSKIRGIIYRLKKQDKIKRKVRGVYIANIK